MAERAEGSPAKRKARRSTLEQSNKNTLGVLEWTDWKRGDNANDSKDVDAPTPINRESVHSNVRQSWLEINEEENGNNPRLVPFAKDVWTVEGPVVNFYGFPYPTRMAVIRLSDGNSWIWSPIELKGKAGDRLVEEVEHTAGPIRHLVSPNYIHWLFLKQWQDKRPNARTYASPGLDKRRVAKDIKFDKVLTNKPDASYAQDIVQVIFEGGVLDEVVFFHKPSKTAIFCDLIQRHREEDLRKNTDNNAFKIWVMKMEEVVGDRGSTPKEWIFSFWAFGLFPKARQQLNVVLEQWQPQKLIIAHGENADKGAILIIDQCLSWIPTTPKECVCCFPVSVAPEEVAAEEAKMS